MMTRCNVFNKAEEIVLICNYQFVDKLSFYGKINYHIGGKAMETKQVLVWRKDLRNVDGHKVRTGKVAAQLAHASLKVFFDRIEYCDHGEMKITKITSAMENWINGLFTKICVSVNSEKELLSIFQQAKDNNIPCSLIQDAGLTEFGGIPTYTAVAIGPAEDKDVDTITGNLKLL